MPDIVGTARFQVLGPLRGYVGQREIRVTSRRDRAMLAALLVRPNDLVPMQLLVDSIWEDQPPQDARNKVHGCVSRLRKLFAAAGGRRDVVVTEPAGYRLWVEPQHVDLNEFRRLRDAARAAAAAGHRAEANQQYRAALGLWRGHAFAGVDTALIRRAAEVIDEERVQAVTECLEIELARGMAGEIVPELIELVRQHPYQERLHAALMLALYRVGRQAEALAAYREAHRVLRDDLAVAPGAALQRLHQAILNRDPELDTPRQPPQRPVHDGREGFRVAVPRTLPPDIPDFVGREKELTQVRDLLTAHAQETVPVVVVSGMAGIGKSALSVHTAHQLRDTYADGQLYADLRGLDEHSRVAPFDLLGRFLRSLGVDGKSMPNSTDERVDLYRTLLSQRRVLVLLDNAADEEQVLPFIPGSGGCGVIVTSRFTLGASLGAQRVTLDRLDLISAAELVAKILGTERAAAEPTSVAELAHLCGHLPLALRISAGELAARPHRSIGVMVERLRDERRRLDRLRLGALDVRASLLLSYTSLSGDARRLLRRLGDLGLPDTNAWVSAALLDCPTDEVEDLLEELIDAQLIDAIAQDPYVRYRLHDLVRLFAAERAVADEAAAERNAARGRALGSWLFVAEAFHRRVFGGLYENVYSSAQRWEVSPRLFAPSSVDPQQWFDTEHDVLVAVVRKAATDGQTTLCWGLASVVSRLVEVLGHHDPWPAVLAEAREVAERTGDTLGLAVLAYRTGILCADLHQDDQARNWLCQARELFEQVGEGHGIALAEAYGAMVEKREGNHEAALQGYQRALPGLREHGDYVGEAFVLRSIGQLHMSRGQRDRADAFLAQALQAAKEAGAIRSEAQVLFWQGMLCLKRDEFERADGLFLKVLQLARQLGDRFGEAQATRGLALCHRGRGDLHQARSTFLDALNLIRQPHPTVIEDRIRHDLDELATADGSA